MHKLTPFLLVAFAIVGSLAGQNPPSVVVHGNCPTDLPGYKQWFQQTKLPHGEPYAAGDKRKQQIFQNYQRLKLKMSVKEVEEVIGRPDFAVPRPAARLSTSPPPADPVCSNQIVYVVQKASENMADMNDAAIYLFFSPSDKLYWVAPQNLPGLKTLGGPE